MSTHQIISVERKPNWWSCKTLDNQWVNVFAPKLNKPGTLRFFEGAGYLLTDMPVGAKLRFTRFPIGVTLVKDREYWNIIAVEDKPDDAVADTPYTPDPALYRRAAREWSLIMAQYLKGDVDGGVKFVLVDLETTGVQFDFDEIIQLAYAPPKHPDFGVRRFVEPTDMSKLSQSTNAAEIHRITPEQLQGWGTFADQYDWIRNSTPLMFSVWVGYNISFDYTMLERAAARAGKAPIIPLSIVDVMPRAAEYIGQWDADRERWRNWKLTEAAEILGISTEDAHDALADCQMTLALLDKMVAGVEPDREVMSRIDEEKEAQG